MALTKVTRNLLSTGIDDQSNATAITIDSSENVGISTSSPGGILDIKKSYSGNTLLSRLWNSEDSDTGSNAEFRIVSGNAATPILTFGDTSAVRHSISVDSSNNLLFKHTGSTERIRITSSGDFNFNYGTGSLGNRYFIINGGSGNDGGIIFQRENANQWQLNNVTGNDNDLSFYSYGSSSYPFTIVTGKHH